MALRRRLGVVAVLAAIGVTAAVALAAEPGTNTLVSRTTGFGPVAAPTTNRSLTTAAGSARLVSDADNHRYVAFVSHADGMSDADDDAMQNVYVRDRQTDTTLLVSRADGVNGAGGNGDSSEASISSDGRYVAFSSAATNLHPAADDGARHIFVRDLVAGSTTVVDRADGANGNVANFGSLEPSLTVVGGVPVVAFSSNATNLDGAVPDFSRQVYVRSGTDTQMVSRRDSSTPPNANAPGDTLSRNPSISTDGSAVAFESTATNLVDSDNNGFSDVFVRTVATGATEMASRNALVIGNNDSNVPSLSGDGTRVAFASRATNLILIGDADTASDVYVTDMGTGNVALASRATGVSGTKANAPAAEAITDDGSTVVFATGADSLVAGDTNGVSDVFARAGLFGGSPTTERVSRPAAGIEADGGSVAPVIARTASGGAYLVAFTTTADNMGTDDENDFSQVYAQSLGGAPASAGLVSRPSGTGPVRSGVNDSFLASQGRSEETVVATSEDGRYTAFMSASDELSADDDDRFINVFRRDNLTGETVLVSRADGPNGAGQNGTSLGAGDGIFLGPPRAFGAPAISADGNRVVFSSEGTNLVASDANGMPDVFVRDVAAGTTVRASVQPDGSELPDASGDPALSGDGTHVAFVTGFAIAGDDTNADADVYLRDLGAPSTVLVSRITPAGAAGNSDSSAPAVDTDGDRVAFASTATDLVPGIFDLNMATDVFLRDLTAGTTRLVSINTGGTATGEEFSTDPAIDGAGNRVAFTTAASDLAATADPNGASSDIALREVGADTTTLVSVTPGGATGNSRSLRASISTDGTRIAFQSSATNIVSPDTNADSDILVRDTAAGTTERASLTPGPAGGQLELASATPSLSGNGDCLMFETRSASAAAGLLGTDFVRVVGRSLRGDCPFGPEETPTPTPTATETPDGSPTPTPTSTAGPDETSPTLTKVKLRPRRFRAGARARLRFTLSERAAVTLRVLKLRPGKTAKKKGKVVFANRPAGANRVRFRGKLRGRKLPPARYRGIVRARDAAGNVSAARKLRFTILSVRAAGDRD